MKARLIRIAIVLIAGAVTYFLRNGEEETSSPPTDARPIPQMSRLSPQAPTHAEKPEKLLRNESHGFDLLQSATVAPHRNNDGDSFHISHLGKEFEIRLYFVDTPEKYIADHNTERLRHQGEYFSSELSFDDTISIGLKAKEFTNQLLQNQRFDVFTTWEAVYDSGRFYAFVQLADGKFLSEHLIENGLARIYTKGVSAPNGMSTGDFKRHLKLLEDQARSQKVGGWSN